MVRVLFVPKHIEICPTCGHRTERGDVWTAYPSTSPNKAITANSLSDVKTKVTNLVLKEDPQSQIQFLEDY